MQDALVGAAAMLMLVLQRWRCAKPSPVSLSCDATPEDIKECFDKHGKLQQFIEHTIPGLPNGVAFCDVKDDTSTLKQIQKMYAHDVYFNQLFSDDFHRVAECCLGAKVEGKNLQFFDKVPKDGFYFMIKPQSAVTGWMALDKADAENGCLRYVEGSHRGGIRDHHPSGVLGFSQRLKEYPDRDRGDQRREMMMACEPGDMVMHHCAMVHMADRNTSLTRHRRALGFIYYRADCKVDEEAVAYQSKIREEWRKQGLL